MSRLEIVNTDRAPKAVGPYSQGIVVDGWLYASGQIGLDPERGSLVGPDTESQTRQVLANLGAVLEAAGARKSDIVKVTIFLVDMDDFPAVNALYADWLGEHRPARATVAVARLPLGARVEMDLVARMG